MRLKGIRIENSLTQEDMAEILDTTPRTYLNKENGKSDFKESEINKILSLFPNKTYEDIFLDLSS